MMIHLIRFKCVILVCSYMVESFGIPHRGRFDYDLIVVGGGAAGMFATGTAASFGCKTLLIDKHDLDADSDFYVGGDCTNAACVPSKAVRCVAKLAAVTEQVSSISEESSIDSDFHFSSISRDHAKNITNAVRSRESPERIASSPNIDILYTPEISFVNKRQVSVKNPYLFNSTFSGFLGSDKGPETTKISAKKFIICTGAGPTIPPTLGKSAQNAGLPILTYRSLFRPDGEGVQSDFLWDLNPSVDSKKKVVIVGGGPTACEISQSLLRLNKCLEISIVAPSILGSEDIALRAAARTILSRDGVSIINRRAVKVSKGKEPILELSDKTHIPVDVLICATGRDPGQNLKELGLEKAGIKWTENEGIVVNSKLQSVTCKNVFAAGDCASAIPKMDRRAAHAGWTGYHAVQSALLPKFLIPNDSVHPYVPRVTFLDPELASIGMTRGECVRKYGMGGFKYVKVSEGGSDRADIDSIERSSDGFVEIRVSIPKGRILGATVCSPAAAEIINEIGVAMVNKLTCRDLAKSIHAYPSYGYLMHRAALSLAMGDIWGVLAACGPVGRAAGSIGRNLGSIFHSRKSERMREWEAIGAENELDYHVSIKSEELDNMSCVSYLDASKDIGFCDIVKRYTQESKLSKRDVRRSEIKVLLKFVKWLDAKPR